MLSSPGIYFSSHLFLSSIFLFFVVYLCQFHVYVYHPPGREFGTCYASSWQIHTFCRVQCARIPFKYQLVGKRESEREIVQQIEIDSKARLAFSIAFKIDLLFGGTREREHCLSHAIQCGKISQFSPHPYLQNCCPCHPSSTICAAQQSWGIQISYDLLFFSLLLRLFCYVSVAFICRISANFYRTLKSTKLQLDLWNLLLLQLLQLNIYL